jgi:outer membrane lipoprotein SlyB
VRRQSPVLNEIGKNSSGSGPDSYRVTVRLDGGDSRSHEQASIGDMRVGDSVRLEDGRLVRH